MQVMQLVRDILRNARFLARRDVSQNGEQELLLSALPERGTFLEIGAGHPVALSNTWRLAKRGWIGVSYDAQSRLRFVWRIFRPRSDFRPFAVTTTRLDHVALHRFPESWWGMSTLDADRAEIVAEQHGIRMERVVVPARYVGAVWLEFVDDFRRAPDLLHLDVEGMDVDLLSELLRVIEGTPLPRFILIETLDGRALPAAVEREFDEVGRRGPSVLLAARGSSTEQVHDAGGATGRLQEPGPPGGD